MKIKIEREREREREITFLCGKKIWMGESDKFIVRGWEKEEPK